jgi:RNA polymerase sigma factor (sigma-70 family)
MTQPIERASHRTGALDAVAETRLVAAAQAGDQAACEELLVAFTPSIRAIARRYRASRTIGQAELMQEGAVGLLRALKRFDPDRGTPFWAYASWWVRQAMQCLVSELTHPVVLSDRALRQLARVRDAERHHLQTHRRPPSARQLAEATGFRAEQVERLQAVDRTPRSLAEPVEPDGDSSMTRLDQLADPDADIAQAHVDRREAISAMRGREGALTARERRVLRERYGFAGQQQHTLREIGDRLDVSAERVRQIEGTALEKLRSAMEPRFTS